MNHGHKSCDVTQSRLHQGFFGRMFRNLPPLEPSMLSDRKSIERLRILAGKMIEEEKDADNTESDNPLIPAGYTYFGQFVDHDLTFDPTSRLDRFNDPDLLNNFRTPSFDLDSIYGKGPEDAPYLYEKDKVKLLITKGKEDDLLRNSEERAIIGDMRNDENIMVSQMQLTFIKFHNAVVTKLQEENFQGDRHALLKEAQRIVTWHYQWVVIYDFIKRIVGEDMLNAKLPEVKGSKKTRLDFFKWRNQVFMPVEFSGAAYRFGHTMVRSTYSLNETLDGFRQNKKLPVFLPPQSNPGPLEDLRGFRRLPGFWTIQWNKFLDFGDTSQLQLSRKLDTKLAFGLSKIPAGPGGQNALAELNLTRGYRLSLPSGQDVARTMGIDPLPNIGGLRSDDPLWFYVLSEAEQGGGEQLGAVGGNIISEVFIGILASDSNSFLNVDPTWNPSKEKRFRIPKIGKDLELRDIVKFAGMPIEASDLPF